MTVEGDGPPSRDELRQLEAAIDARFDAVDICFSTMEQRFDCISERLDAAVHATRSLVERSEGRLRSLDDRVDVTGARLGATADEVIERLERHHLGAGFRLLLLMIAMAIASCIVVVTVLVAVARY